MNPTKKAKTNLGEGAKVELSADGGLELWLDVGKKPGPAKWEATVALPPKATQKLAAFLSSQRAHLPRQGAP